MLSHTVCTFATFFTTNALFMGAQNNRNILLSIEINVAN
jgi:hypothetical protein